LIYYFDQNIIFFLDIFKQNDRIPNDANCAFFPSQDPRATSLIAFHLLLQTAHLNHWESQIFRILIVCTIAQTHYLAWKNLFPLLPHAVSLTAWRVTFSKRSVRWNFYGVTNDLLKNHPDYQAIIEQVKLGKWDFVFDANGNFQADSMEPL
jgi:hypothetical protein